MIYSNNKEYVSWPATHVKRPGGLKPKTLNIFLKSEEAKAIFPYISSQMVCQMPVTTSPMYVLLMYFPDTNDVWAPRYTNSLDSIADLTTYLNCSLLVSPNEEVSKMYRENADDIRLQFQSKALKCNSVQSFVTGIKAYTIQYINMLEKCLYKLLVQSGDLSLQACLTKDENIQVKELSPGQQYQLRHREKVFFKQKEILQNEYDKTDKIIWFDANKDLYPQYLGFIQKTLK